jgi:hypothetical protein
MNYCMPPEWIKVTKSRAMHERFYRAEPGAEQLTLHRKPLGNKQFLRLQTCVRGMHLIAVVTVGPLDGQPSRLVTVEEAAEALRCVGELEWKETLTDDKQRQFRAAIPTRRD